MIYNKDTYLNRDIDYLISNEIIEYDMAEGGFNIIKYFKLLDPQTIETLEMYPKDVRKIKIGLLQRNDPNLAKNMLDGFAKAREMFYKANNLIDDDILSIKKDAMFITKRCHVTKFDNIIFREKNIYTSYFYMNKLEFYVGMTKLDVKGINDSKLELHSEFMLDFLFKLFKMIETSDRRNVIRGLVSFADSYKNKDLDIGYYRELNKESLFRWKHKLSKVNNIVIGTNDLTLNKLNDIDISYNYTHYIVPLIQLLQ